MIARARPAASRRPSPFSPNISSCQHPASAYDEDARLQSTLMLTAYRYKMAGRRRDGRPLSCEPPSGAFTIRFRVVSFRFAS